MRDPDSAKFSRSSTKEVGGVYVTCGFVNARNGFRGYAGDTMWIVSDGLGIAVLNAPGKSMRLRYCGTNTAQARELDLGRFPTDS